MRAVLTKGSPHRLECWDVEESVLVVEDPSSRVLFDRLYSYGFLPTTRQGWGPWILNQSLFRPLVDQHPLTLWAHEREMVVNNLRFAVHEIAHAWDLDAPINAALVARIAALGPAAEWRNELVARCVEHLTLPKLGRDNRPLEPYVKAAIRTATNLNRNGPALYHVATLEEAMALAYELLETRRPHELSEQILKLNESLVNRAA